LELPNFFCIKPETELNEIIHQMETKYGIEINIALIDTRIHFDMSENEKLYYSPQDSLVTYLSIIKTTLTKKFMRDLSKKYRYDIILSDSELKEIDYDDIEDFIDDYNNLIENLG
jgi:hypothetical protein